jgi:hypothetical protein
LGAGWRSPSGVEGYVGGGGEGVGEGVDTEREDIWKKRGREKKGALPLIQRGGPKEGSHKSGSGFFSDQKTSSLPHSILPFYNYFLPLDHVVSPYCWTLYMLISSVSPGSTPNYTPDYSSSTPSASTL